VIARKPDGVERVAVAQFRLPKPFKPALWSEARSELRKVADTIAVQTSPDAKVAAPEVARVARRRALAFDITYERDGKARVDRLIFLLVGTREFQLTCSILLADRAAGDAACEQLRKSFRLRTA
jgi:hypothetical protein